MIDNVLLEHRVPLNFEVRLRRHGERLPIHRVTQLDRALGRPVTWLRMPGPGFWLGYSPDTRRLQLLFSVARFHNYRGFRIQDRVGEVCNFPLHDFRDVDAMNLNQLSKFILTRLGRRFGIFDDVRPRVGVPEWIVRRIAYAIDIRTDDANRAIGAAATLQRMRTREAEVRGQPGGRAHSVTWEAGGVRVMFYNKGAQLRRHPALRTLRLNDDQFPRAAREHLQRMARDAENVVRIEITLLGLDPIRSALKLAAPLAPTLRLMTEPAIESFFWWREMRNLRLSLVAGSSAGGNSGEVSGSTENDICIDVRGLWRQFEQAHRARGQIFNISQARLKALFGIYFLLVAHRENAAGLNMPPSSLSKARRQLGQLGLVPCADLPTTSTQGEIERLVNAIRQVRSQVSDQCPEFNHRMPWVRPVPWSEEAPTFPTSHEVEDFSDIIASIESIEEDADLMADDETLPDVASLDGPDP